MLNGLDSFAPDSFKKLVILESREASTCTLRIKFL